MTMVSATAIVQSTPTLPYKVPAGSRAAQHGFPLKTFRNRATCKQRVSKGRRIQRIHTRAGLPVVSNIPVVGPIVNFVLNPAVLLGIYVAGAIQFLAGFSRTTYSDTFTNRVGLTTTWPKPRCGTIFWPPAPAADWCGAHSPGAFWAVPAHICCRFRHGCVHVNLGCVHPCNKVFKAASSLHT